MKYGRKTLIVSGAVVCLVACSTFIPRQGWRDSYGPVVPHDTFPTDCALCHVGGSWTEIRDDFTFDHLADAGLALNGAHTNAQCLLCHNDRGPADLFAAKGCAGCHQDDHRGRLGPACDDCHNENTWQPIEAIQLHAQTRFPLVGPHAATECFQCHKGAQVGNFEGLDPQCIVCHQSDLARAIDPDHIGQGWVEDCQQCHLQLEWTPARFDHPASFGLVGGHSGRECTDCHTPGTFTGLTTECVSCHVNTYNQTTAPNHAVSGFSTECQQCHSVFSWPGANFLHPASFPLSGGHNLQDCTLCHQGGVFAGTPTNCVSCHLNNYNATTDPNHQQSGFSTDCMQCHDTVDWRNATFNHSFPIDSGPHAVLNCIDCHTNPAATPQFSCIDCHQHSQQIADDQHKDVSGYVWSSASCFACHPNGRG
jgi:hypothetical protein